LNIGRVGLGDDEVVGNEGVAEGLIGIKVMIKALE
jgi:hypothetical protein